MMMMKVDMMVMVVTLFLSTTHIDCFGAETLAMIIVWDFPRIHSGASRPPPSKFEEKTLSYWILNANHALSRFFVSGFVPKVYSKTTQTFVRWKSLNRWFWLMWTHPELPFVVSDLSCCCVVATNWFRPKNQTTFYSRFFLLHFRKFVYGQNLQYFFGIFTKNFQIFPNLATKKLIWKIFFSTPDYSLHTNRPLFVQLL